MSDEISVVIADDHPYEVSGIADLLNFANHINVVGTAHTAQQAVLEAMQKQPDVILLDMKWYKNDYEGLAAIKQIKDVAPETRILVMTAYDELVEAARTAGADRAIHKDYLNSKEALVDHIRAAYQARLLPNVGKYEDPFAKLSRREFEVLQLLCQYLTDKAIADNLSLSWKTIKKYNVNIYSKLGVSGRTEAVAYAIQNGIFKKKDKNDKDKNAS